MNHRWMWSGGLDSNLLKSTICRSPVFMKMLYISDVRLLLDFASPVRNTGFLGDLNLLESVQRCWTKQVDGLSSLPYLDRLDRLNLFSINGRLLCTDLIQCYKIFHDLSAIKPNDLFVMAANLGTRGHSLKILHPRPTTEARRRYFSCRIVKDWNALPIDVVNAPSLPHANQSLTLYPVNHAL